MRRHYYIIDKRDPFGPVLVYTGAPDLDALNLWMWRRTLRPSGSSRLRHKGDFLILDTTFGDGEIVVHEAAKATFRRCVFSTITISTQLTPRR